MHHLPLHSDLNLDLARVVHEERLARAAARGRHRPRPRRRGPTGRRGARAGTGLEAS
jgi:hypothetical protein